MNQPNTNERIDNIRARILELQALRRDIELGITNIPSLLKNEIITREEADYLNQYGLANEPVQNIQEKPKQLVYVNNNNKSA